MKNHCKKIFSLLLAMSLLLTLAPVIPVTAEETATATNETTLSGTEEITEAEPELESFPSNCVYQFGISKS